MSFAFFAAFVATGVFVGRLLDAGLGRLYDPALKKWLQDGSLNFDDVKYWDIVSTSPDRAIQVHRWIAGRGLVSWQALVAAIIMSACSFFTFAMMNIDMISNMRMAGQTQQQVDWDILKNFGFVWLGLMLGALVLVKLAWKLVLALISRAKRSLLSIFATYFLLSAITILLFPVPYLIAHCFWLGSALSINPSGWGELKFLPSAILESAPTIYLIILTSPLLIFYAMFYNWEAKFYLYGLCPLMSGLPVFFPVLAYVLILLWDLLLKPVIRPVSVFVSGLLEYLHQEKYPMTWIFGTLGAIPGLIKMWMEATHGK